MSLILSGIIAALFLWAKFAPFKYQLPAELIVSDIATGVALITGLLALILRLVRHQKHAQIFATIVYVSTLGLFIALALTLYNSSLILIATWTVVAIVAGVFGNIMVGIVLAVAVTLSIFNYLQHDLTIQVAIINAIFYLTPAIIGHFLWQQPSNGKTSSPFADLAHKLSTVEGKSDVVINTIDDGVVTIGRGEVIDLINPAAQTLVGWNQGDALGLDWRSVLKLVNAEGRDLTEAENPIHQSLSQNKSTHSDKFFLQTGSGKRRLVSVVSSPIGQAGSGIVVVFRDITKEKAEEREQAEFISTASHEMRTPVASIEGYLGLALNPTTATIDDKAREFINKAHESAQHLGRLFQDLLDISKAEDGRLKSEPQIVDVSAMAGDIFGGLAHLAEEKNLRFLFKPNPSLETDSAERRLQPVFYADIDPNHFREVVANLIENAIKYTNQGDVIVDVIGDDKVVTVSVQDTGIGIPPEDIPHLFQKFYRVDNSDTREIGGTGLGLYLSRKLAETMGGHLRVESQYQQGSTFFLDIPRTSHEDAMRKLDSASEQPNMVPENRTALPSQPVIEQPITVFESETTTINQAPVPTETTAAIPEIQPTYHNAETGAAPIAMTLADIENTIAAQPQFEQVSNNNLPQTPPPVPIENPASAPAPSQYPDQSAQQRPESYTAPPR